MFKGPPKDSQALCRGAAQSESGPPHSTGRRRAVAPPFSAKGAAARPAHGLLTAPLACHQVERLRGAVKRQTYAYAVPYAFLLTPLELSALAAGATATAPAIAAAPAAAADAVGRCLARCLGMATGGVAGGARKGVEGAEGAKGGGVVVEVEVEAEAAAEAEAEAGVWLSNAPHGCWTKPDLTPVVAEQAAPRNAPGNECTVRHPMQCTV